MFLGRFPRFLVWIGNKSAKRYLLYAAEKGLWPVPVMALIKNCLWTFGDDFCSWIGRRDYLRIGGAGAIMSGGLYWRPTSAVESFLSTDADFNQLRQADVESSAAG
jgi:hypothetical protein